MRRALILLISTLLMGMASAQRPFLENTFLSVGGGLNTYANDAYSIGQTKGFNGQVAAGYHFSNSVAMRATISGMTNSSTTGVNGLYIYGHGDLLWNIPNSFLGYNGYRQWGAEAIYGFGLAHACPTGDNDFVIFLGARGTYRTKCNVLFFLEGSTMLHPSEFDHNERLSWAPAITGGLELFINENAYYNRDNPGCPSPSSDWYLGFGLIGITSFQYNGIEDFGQRMQMVRPAVEVNIGKSFTPCWGGRVSLSGGQGGYTDMVLMEGNPQPKEVEDSFLYFSSHCDMMFNLTQALLKPRFMPRLTVFPYGGAGLIYRADQQKELRIGLNGGLMLRYIVGQQSDVYLDLRHTITQSGFAHLEGYNQGRFSVGLTTITAGYILNLGQGRYRNPR